MKAERKKIDTFFYRKKTYLMAHYLALPPPARFFQHIMLQHSITHSLRRNGQFNGLDVLIQWADVKNDWPKMCAKKYGWSQPDFIRFRCSISVSVMFRTFILSASHLFTRTTAIQWIYMLHATFAALYTNKMFHSKLWWLKFVRCKVQFIARNMGTCRLAKSVAVYDLNAFEMKAFYSLCIHCRTYIYILVYCVRLLGFPFKSNTFFHFILCHFRFFCFFRYIHARSFIFINQPFRNSLLHKQLLTFS